MISAGLPGISELEPRIIRFDSSELPLVAGLCVGQLRIRRRVPKQKSRTSAIGCADRGCHGKIREA
jgi:hypothetical protein